MSTTDDAPLEETPQVQPRSSSVLFALGKLTAESAALRSTVERVPGDIMAALNPRFVALEGLPPRVRDLERNQWIVVGGFSVAIFVMTKGPALWDFLKR